MSEKKIRFNAVPEMNACTAEMADMLGKWHARSEASPETSNGLFVVHTATLQAYALWFTQQMEPDDEEHVLAVRSAILDALNESRPEQAEAAP